MTVPPSLPGPQAGPTGDGGEGWWNLFEAAAELPPRPSQKKRRRTLIIAASVATVAIAGVVVAVAVLNTTTTTPTQAASVSPARVPDARLLGMLPAGIRADTCKADAEPGAQPSIVCAGSGVAGEPTGLTMIAAPDIAGLNAELNQVGGRTNLVLCAGNIMSPGPWRRYPDQPPSGTLMCGLQDKHSVLAWTDDARLVTLVAVGEPGPAALVPLYHWWTQHA